MKTDFLNKLNPQQKNAATSIEGPVLIIAGAGSGKTTVLINRLAYMIEAGISPKNILLLTFTNNAAENMKERAGKLGDKKCGDVMACTYHSFCAKILREYAKEAGLLPNFSIIGSNECADAIRLAKADLGFSGRKGLPPNGQIVGLISMAINTRQELKDIIKNSGFEEFEEELLAIAKYYEIYKRENNLCDYDDLLIFMNKLLDNLKVRAELSKQYRYIMVDEYQDTNKLQEEIVFKLSDNFHNLCVVGDDFQSIYRFNGADINNILNFPNKFKNCKEIPIVTNYRSRETILDTANTMMNHHADFGYKKEMIPFRKEGEKPLLICPRNQEEEAEYILQKIHKLSECGKKLEDSAILFRQSSLAVPLELLLTKYGIPYKMMGGVKFLEKECVQDMLAYIRVLNNPHDTLAWYRVLCTIPGIGDVYASEITKRASSNFTFLVESFQNRKFYRYLKVLKRVLEAVCLKDQEEWFIPLKKLYLDFRKEAIETAHVSEEGKRTEMYQVLKNNIDDINVLELIYAKYKKVQEFLDNVMLDTSTTQDEEEQDVLTLSTIHSAKGLEWDTVFMIDCVDNVFPRQTKEWEGTPDYQEELRCFYVALTRAKDNLYILSPQTVILNGKCFSGSPSHFLEEVIEKEIVVNPKDVVKKHYLQVPYYQKDIAKGYGAKWDNEKKKWYYLSNGYNDKDFERWE